MIIQDLERKSQVFGFYDLKNQLKKFIYDSVEEAIDAGDSARDAVER